MRKARQTRSLVAAWFDFLAPAEAPVAFALHKTIRAVAPDLTDVIRQGNLLMSMNGEPLLAIAPVRDRVHLLIFSGSDLEHELGAMDGAGRRQRLVKFAGGAPVDVARVERIARVCVDFCRRRQQLADGR
ncbi:MAG: DUF1801 domain-containing protein [Burkholderiaceae bacterium]